MNWNDRSSQAQLLLDGSIIPQVVSGEELLNLTTKILAEVDLILKKAPLDANAGTVQHQQSLAHQLIGGAQSDSAVDDLASPPDYSGVDHGSSSNHWGSGSNTDIFDVEKPIFLPLSHPAHQYQASQFFGAAAIKSILPPSSSPSSQQQQLGRISQSARLGLSNLNSAAAPLPSSIQPLPLDNDSSDESTPRSSSQVEEGPGIQSAPGSYVYSSRYELPTDATIPTTGQSSGQILSGSTIGTNAAPTSRVSEASGIDPTGVASSGIGPSTGTPLTRDDAVMGGGSSSSKLGASQVGAPQLVGPAASSSALSLDADASRERTELVAKYLFIHSLLAKMIASAQLSYQVSLQLESLRKRLKPKRTKGLAPEAVAALQSEFDEKQVVLRDSRDLFLRSKLTLQWFYADFQLNYAMQLLRETELRVQQQRAVEGASADSAMPPRIGAGSTLPPSEHATTLARLDGALLGLTLRRAAVELRLTANERYALSIALSYLAAHSPGEAMSPEDAVDLDPTLYQLLDPGKERQVRREQLHMCIIMLAQTLDTLHARIRALEMHNQTMSTASPDARTVVGALSTGGQNANVVVGNASKIARLEGEAQEVRKTLQALNGYFLHTFTRNVFVNLDTSDAISGSVPLATIEAPKVDVMALRSDLASVTAASGGTKAINPLDVRNEGRVGPDEMVPRENIGTGRPAEWTATAIDGGANITPQSGEDEQSRMRSSGILPTAAGFGVVGAAGASSISETAPVSVVGPSALAQVASPATLQIQATHLTHVPEGDVQPSVFGGRHAKDADIPTTAVVEAGVIDIPSNSSLAPLVHPAELQDAEAHLKHSISPSRHTRTGSVHEADAIIMVPPEPEELRSQASNLHRVSWSKAQRTSTGGIHSLTKQDLTEVLSPEPNIQQQQQQPEAETGAAIRGPLPVDHSAILLRGVPIETLQGQQVSNTDMPSSKAPGAVDIHSGAPRLSQIATMRPLPDIRQQQLMGLHQQDESINLNRDMVSRASSPVDSSSQQQWRADEAKETIGGSLTDKAPDGGLWPKHGTFDQSVAGTKDDLRTIGSAPREQQNVPLPIDRTGPTQ